MTVYTIGHSTRQLDELIAVLESFDIRLLVDVRSIPRSRYNPQFNSDAFANALESRDIEYQHMSGLGGLRKPRTDSPNTGWRNAGFRGYADYMQIPEFKESLDCLTKQATTNTTALMCAEAVSWRCHRSLISDALLVRDIEVQHILDKDKTQPATLTEFAEVNGTDITYPSTQQLLLRNNESNTDQHL